MTIPQLRLLYAPDPAGGAGGGGEPIPESKGGEQTPSLADLIKEIPTLQKDVDLMIGKRMAEARTSWERQNLTPLQQRLEALEGEAKKREDEARTAVEDAAKKAGDWTAMEKSLAEKHNKEIAARDGRITALDATLKNVATKIALTEAMATLPSGPLALPDGGTSLSDIEAIVLPNLTVVPDKTDARGLPLVAVIDRAAEQPGQLRFNGGRPMSVAEYMLEIYGSKPHLFAVSAKEKGGSGGTRTVDGAGGGAGNGGFPFPRGVAKGRPAGSGDAPIPGAPPVSISSRDLVAQIGAKKFLGKPSSES